mmetsp:Transcript_47799/g.139438  ORF Transcript_47799/g.139438 Transcript_47799/m.139438 type:complete len:207 (-) Transcript_47799:60-680(-)
MAAVAADAAPGAFAPASRFEFPPFYNLPPFFTLQQHEGVRAKQLSLWKQVILDFCAFNRLFILDISDGGVAGGTAGLFRNAGIQRQLSAEARRTIADHLVREGAAAWADAGATAAAPEPRQRLLVLWKSAGEWADMILRWAEDTGRMGSVETVFSLTDGDITEGEAFHGAPRELVIHALQELERRGRAKIFRGTSTGSEGVKFLQA